MALRKYERISSTIRTAGSSSGLRDEVLLCFHQLTPHDIQFGQRDLVCHVVAHTRQNRFPFVDSMGKDAELAQV
jgi:hypothetical protein